VTVAATRRRAPLYSLLSASGTSLLGDILTAIAIPWFVLQTTGSAGMTGVAAAVTVLPTVIVGAFGGALVDRFGHRRTSIVSDLASAAAVAMIPLLHLTVGIAFWQLLALIFVGGVLDVPGRTARQSLLPDMAAMGDVTLERANSAFSAIDRGSSLVGPLLAGVMIALVGPANILFINAATFVVSALIVAAAVPAPAREVGGDVQSASYLQDLAAGFRFIRRDRVILSLLIIMALANFLANPVFAVILPVYASQVYGDPVYLGMMLGGFGGGAMLGVVLYGAIGHRFSRRRITVIAFLLGTIPFGVLTLTPGLAVVIGATFLLGLVVAPLTPLVVTVIQERTPADMRGRVFGLMMSGAWVVLPLGMMAAGFLLEAVGLRATLIAVAAGLFALATSVLLNPALHEMDAAPAASTSPARAKAAD
jgi:MFS family permease